MTGKDGFGFEFDFTACASCGGRCCTGESGYIWVSPKEMEAIANLLGMDFNEFTSNYIKKVGYRYSLVERKNGEAYECIFFDTKLKQCSIYEARPKQCREFPFWDIYKDDIKEVQKECPGIVLL